MSGLFAPAEIVGGIAIGTGVGAAVGDVVLPKLQDFLNSQWEAHPDKPLNAASVAQAIAEALPGDGGGAAEAARSGFNSGRLSVLAELQRTAPGTPQLLTLLRRKFIGIGDFTHGLRKAKLDTRWDGPIGQLVDELLDPTVLAVAIQRGIIPDPGILPVGPGAGGGKVPSFPVFPVDALAEALGSGIDRERLSVMVGNVGLPMSLHEAASAYFRGIIELNDFHRAVSEGNTRNEWRDAILEQARPIPSVLDYVQAHLRGWRNEDQMHAGAQRSGMRDADTDLLFQIHGRPPSWHQIWIGLQRGGVYDGPIDIIDPAFLKGLRESDLRPEWYNLLWHSRYSYPSPFVLRQLTTSHAITVEDAEQVLKFEGYEPTFAKKIAEAWGGGAGGTAATDPHVGKAQTNLYTALHRSYVAEESDAAAVGPGLDALGIPGPAQADVLNLWNLERSLIREQLSPAQIKKAVKGAVLNPATGQPWTTADAMVALLARGYDQADAQTLIEEF